MIAGAELYLVAAGALALGALTGGLWHRRFTVNLLQAAARAVRELGEGVRPGWPDRDGFGRAGADLAEALERAAELIKARQADLERANTDLQTILGAMQDGVILLDHRRRVRLLNAAARRIFSTVTNRGGQPAHREATEKAWQGRHYLELTHHSALDDAVGRVLATRQTEILEITPTLPPGTILEAHVVPVDPDGALLVTRDITRYRQLERMRSQFVANVTHELQTPMTAIRGFAETLIDGALEQPEAARRFLKIIVSETERLGRLIDDLLQLAKIESPRAPTEARAAVALAPLWAEMRESFAIQAERAGIELEGHVPDELPPALANRDQLRQVLLNLVDNALKYTPSGGHVSVSAHVADGDLLVTVRDTGIGIPSEDLERVFERFYRVDKARSRATGGTGLGLSIVKHIVENHGGRVWVESTPGEGSSFHFTLPVAPAV